MALEQTPKPSILELKAHPLGCEVDITWEFEEILHPQYQLYIFKRSKANITDEEIDKYLTSPTKENLASGLFVFLNIPNDQRNIIDTMVEEGQTYFYRAIVVKREDRGTRSEMIDKEITVPKFDAKINVVSTKEIIIDAIKKILKGVAKQTKANVMVYEYFPLKVVDPAYVVVTRSSGENAYRSMSDVYASYQGQMITGDVDSDVIQIAWMTNSNPSLRDKFTDIFRGTKRVLKRYLRMQQGVLDVNFTMLGDGAEEIDGQQLHYGSMLVNVMIQNLLSTTENNLASNILYEFNFQTDSFLT